MHLSSLSRVEAFTTLDGSTIREIAHPSWTPARNQSLAEATVPAGRRDDRPSAPRAPRSCTSSPPGSGRLRVGDEERDVAARGLRRHPAGHPAQAVGRCGRPARAAVLLRAGLRRRRHGAIERRNPPDLPIHRPDAPFRSPPHRGSSPPSRVGAPAAGALTIGIADQKADMFSDVRFQDTGITHARLLGAVGRARGALRAPGARRVDAGRPRRGRQPADLLRPLRGEPAQAADARALPLRVPPLPRAPTRGPATSRPGTRPTTAASPPAIAPSSSPPTSASCAWRARSAASSAPSCSTCPTWSPG